MVNPRTLSVDEYLCGVRGARFYKAVELTEFLSFFPDSQLHDIHSCSTDACVAILLERIHARQGAVADVRWGASEKVLSLDQLRRQQATAGFRVSVVSGCFDLLHLGHLRGLRFAKKESPSNKLAVLLLSDAAIHDKKGADRPILDINERVSILAAVREVDFVVPLVDPDCLRSIRTLKPGAFFKSPGDSAQQIVREEQDLVRSEGGAVIEFPARTQVTHTSELVRRARRQEIAPTIPEDGELGRLLGQWPLPRMLGIMLTRACNLRCPFCFTCSSPRMNQHLPLDVLRRVLDEARGWGVRHVRLTGGEPTLHPHFAEVLDACRERELDVSLNTNGIYTRDTLRYLCGSSVGFFLVSVDGSEGTNDSLRGSGAYRRTVSSLEALHQSGQRLMVSFHAGARNYRDIGALAALCAHIGVGLRVGPLRPCGRAEEQRGDILTPTQYLDLTEEIERLRERHPGLAIHTDFDILGPLRVDGRYSAGLRCKAGRELVFLSCDGGVYPCAFFTPDPTFCAGYVHAQSIATLWHTSSVFAPFRSPDRIAGCETCTAYQHQCAGGCRAMAYFMTGTVYGHDPTCFAHLLSRSAVEGEQLERKVGSGREEPSGD